MYYRFRESFLITYSLGESAQMIAAGEKCGLILSTTIDANRPPQASKILNQIQNDEQLAKMSSKQLGAETYALYLEKASRTTVIFPFQNFC